MTHESSASEGCASSELIVEGSVTANKMFLNSLGGVFPHRKIPNFQDPTYRVSPEDRGIFVTITDGKVGNQGITSA